MRAARASLWSLAGQGGQQLVGVLSFLLLARWLSPADYGLAGMAAAVSGVLAIAGDTGVVASLVRQPDIDEVAEATAFWVALAGAAVLAGVVAASAPLLAWYFADTRIAALALAMGLNFLLAVPGRVSTAKLAKQLDFSRLARVGFVASLSGLLAGVLIARKGGGAWALYAQMATTFAAQAALLVASAPYRVSVAKFSREKAASLATFGSEMTGFLLAVTLARTGDTVLGGRLIGPAPLGLLSMGAKLGVVPVQRLSGALSSVFMPAYFEMAEGSRGAAFSRALSLTAVVTFPVSLGIFAVAPEVVAFLPARWSGLVPTLRILSVGTLVEPLAGYSFAVLSAQGRSTALFRLGLLLVPIGWVGSLFGGLAGSAKWLAAASVAWSAANAVGMAALIWRPLALNRSIVRRLAVPLVAALTMAGAVRAVLTVTETDGRRMGLVVGVATGALIYGLALCTVLRADRDRLVDLLRGALWRRHAFRGRNDPGITGKG